MIPRTSLAAIILLAVSVIPSHAQQKRLADKADRLVKTYSVADLVVPITERSVPCYDTSGKTVDCATPIKTIEAELMNLIRMSVAPLTWRENGGHGTMQYFPLGMAIVIQQKLEVHEEISALLAALRRLQDLEVAVEIKVVRASAKTLKGLCKASGCANQPAFLADAEVRDLFKKLQEDSELTVAQAPKLTLANGQVANLRIGEELSILRDVAVNSDADTITLKPKNEIVQTGWSWRIVPVVSADRRHVRLALDLTFRSVEGPPSTASIAVPAMQKQTAGTDQKLPLTLLVQRPNVVTRRLEHTISVPDGWTALLHGGVVSPSEAGVEMHEIVMVTPRIFVREEEERRFDGPIPRP